MKLGPEQSPQYRSDSAQAPPFLWAASFSARTLGAWNQAQVYMNYQSWQYQYKNVISSPTGVWQT